jgi:midasin
MISTVTLDDRSSEVSFPFTDDTLAVGEAGADTTSLRGLGLSQTDQKTSDSPFRRPGDASQEIQNRVEEILDAQSDKMGEDVEASTQVEHLRPDDSDHDMQVLGPAGEDQAASLDELKFAAVRDAPQSEYTPMDVDASLEPSLIETRLPRFHSDSYEEAHKVAEEVDGTVTNAEVRGQIGSTNSNLSVDPSNTMADVEMEGTENEDVEVELRKWQAEDYPEESTGQLWRLYESLTQDLAHVLCEQLRLILEPTRATRLKGDYRTGKRLNMKKIIPFIASEYTKDKIWLRRTRPSQREYQVLIALDDSRSMAESHSIHLSYQTLALVAKALNRLEVGDIAIVKFGEAMDVLHGFDDGPFTDQAGVKVMDAFRFNQKATNVLSLVSSSLKVLEAARDRRSLSSAAAAELWQLEIIISDGVCQDHDRLRPLLRRAQEQRVMIVFIIIDSLHSGAGATASSMPMQNSILSMNQVTYSEVDGKLEMQVNRYLDSFPFEFFVVLRSVEALPEVLSNTLKQFFERIAEK